MKNSRSLRAICIILLISVIVGCEKKTPVPEIIIEEIQKQEAEATPYLLDNIVLTDKTDRIWSDEDYDSRLPNLWTTIDKKNMEIYYESRVNDYTYSEDGSLWLVGSFGIIHKQLNNQFTWYSIKTGLPINYFTSIAFSPTGELWAGGESNTLLRFDGTDWIDEGSQIPPPLDGNSSWLCYSETITGIDFDQKGNIWIMNDGIEIYTKVYDQWMNFPFPKDILPRAGGGGCPIGIRVVSENNITIERSGCCMSDPAGYHFNGEEWTENADYSIVDEIIESRHNGEWVRWYDWDDILIGNNGPFEEKYILPIFSNGLSTDDNGVIWISGQYNLANNENGKFEEAIDYSHSLEDPIISESQILNFGEKIIYYQKDRDIITLGEYYSPNPYSSFVYRYPTVDDNNQIWIYTPDEGLTKIVNGQPFIISKLTELTKKNTGGSLILADGRIAVGSINSIWMYENSSWQKTIIPNNDQLFTFIRQDQNGIVYAATDTGVYEIHDASFAAYNFVDQDAKPIIVPVNQSSVDCSFNKYYSEKGCTDNWYGSPLVHYRVVFLDVKDDGTVYYVNNKIVARFKDGKWVSFLFTPFNIWAATVDDNEDIWLTIGGGSIIKLDSDFFDSYQPLIKIE